MRPILHHYDASPFSRKAQKMLGIKNLSWLSVEMPMTAPKPDIQRLTGGYRGTPVLQVGANLYVDNGAIAIALDSLYPHAPRLTYPDKHLFQAGIARWADALFEPVLRAAIGLYAPSWDEQFRRDREAVFPHLNFEQLPLQLPNYYATILALVTELDAHIAGTGGFIDGGQPNVSDVHCWGILWFVLAGLPDVAQSMIGLEALHRWYSKMEALGVGQREEGSYDVAWGAVREGQAQVLAMDDPSAIDDSPVTEWLGRDVAVHAESADRGSIIGCLRTVTQHYFVLTVTQQEGVLTQVHLPRVGYRIDLR